MLVVVQLYLGCGSGGQWPAMVLAADGRSSQRSTYAYPLVIVKMQTGTAS